MSEQKFETLQIHAGMAPDPTYGARTLPIYQSNAFVFPSADVAANRFALSELGQIYTRITNPTNDAVENKIAALEGGVGALLLASGQSATTLAILNVAGAGDHIVAAASLYGGTQNLFKHTLKKIGIETTFIQDPDNLDEWRSAIQDNTKAFFGEFVANPRSDVLDISGVAGVAHDYGVPLIVDNTLTTPYLGRPIEHGADIVTHSATKFLGGHATAMGGVIVDSGNFDYAQYPERFPGFNEPDESYNGLVYARDLGVGSAFGANLSYILKARVQLLRDLGPSISPHNAFEINLGLETLSLRMERHVENAAKVAAWLDEREDANNIAFAGLPSSPWYERGKQLLPKGVGSIISFELDGGREAGIRFVDALKLHSNVANVGDVRSLVIHPASTTHSQLTDPEQLAAGVNPSLVRLSVGLEHIDDIIADLELGFAAAADGA
ncbi:O-acetylhomoserine aminocarboxypropyltransferase/cysteine synthase family protein [Micrococcoides hystricis]|uniref:O-acetylhomoserine aminocarboxypropyltransferase/cysteine synthase family protein n=1 Tax=Micrococcoides hystricis TaxID=1572761 RepID=A0ABV6PAE8_9MICC